VTHNHPNGDSFSRRDIQVMLDNRILQMRVVTRDWTYILDLPEDALWEDVVDLVAIVRDQVEATHRDMLLAGELTLEGSEQQWWHDIWTNVAEIRSWSYRRIPLL
jgi:hypothetical protein